MYIYIYIYIYLYLLICLFMYLRVIQLNGHRSHRKAVEPAREADSTKSEGFGFRV